MVLSFIGTNRIWPDMPPKVVNTTQGPGRAVRSSARPAKPRVHFKNSGTPTPPPPPTTNRERRVQKRMATQKKQKSDRRQAARKNYYYYSSNLRAHGVCDYGTLPVM